VTRSTAFIVATAALIVAALQIGPVAAASRYQRLDARHVAYTDVATDYYPCRLGWWQSLRFGHVRPQWGTRCR